MRIVGKFYSVDTSALFILLLCVFFDIYSIDSVSLVYLSAVEIEHFFYSLFFFLWSHDHFQFHGLFGVMNMRLLFR